ncbi:MULTISPECIES: hypothetical protein [Clostridium]|jgi:hypothetical protein|uniref:hypothetical protein n=1 Tax=Clostridium TaxID=1485 RepID=UPI000D5F26D6|nr:hypothetical protein [Clostridium thermopalmarium]PVZ20927.1 hypothetical protein LX19_02521 [Clostridium thermopalmarium DSM 5974]
MPELLYKLKQILQFVEAEANKPLENHNLETRLWSKGYRKAMIVTRNFILNILNKDI